MSEFRKDPLSPYWVIFAPERQRRPQPIQLAQAPLEELRVFTPGYEYLTTPEVFSLRQPGTAANHPGWSVRVIPNRYPAVRVEASLDPEMVGRYQKLGGLGAHEVIIETNSPELALEELSVSGVADVFLAWQARIHDLTRDQRLVHFVLYKNHGFLAGATLPHAHSQLMALPFVPPEMQMELEAARRYRIETGTNWFDDMIQQELSSGQRLVYENEHFWVFCPYASRFAFEMVVVPKRPGAWFADISDHERGGLGDATRQALGRLRSGVGRPSYNLILHSAPVRHIDHGSVADSYRWRLAIVPRLNGLAGFEISTGCYLNAVLPEEAARFLREQTWA